MAKSNDGQEVHPWFAEAARGLPVSVDGSTEFTFTDEVPTPSHARYKGAVAAVKEWQKQDFGGVEISKVDIKPPKDASGDYGNFSKPDEQNPWEVTEKNLVTKVTVHARVTGQLVLENMDPDVATGLSGAVKKRLAEKLDEEYPLRVVDTLPAYTVDGLMIGMRGSTSSKFRPKRGWFLEGSFMRSLDEIYIPKMHFGRVVESSEEGWMIVEVVWKEAATLAERAQALRTITVAINTSRSEKHQVHFLVW